jgi:hypothetical protein
MLSLQQDVHELGRIIATPRAPSRTPGLGSGEDSWAGTYAWAVPGQEHPVHTSEDPVASSRMEFPYHSTLEPIPTAYPARSGTAELNIVRSIFAMVPAIPLTILHNLDWKSFTDIFLSGFEKVFGAFKVVLNYPLPP